LERGVREAVIDELIASWRNRKTDDLKSLEKEWLGKDGRLKRAFSHLKDLPNDEKPKFARVLNELKAEVEEFFKNNKGSSRKIREMDLTVPGISPGLGTLHPITLIEQRISKLLAPFGFQSLLGPELETEYNCFDSLNIPKHHPARDMQDTFYCEDLPNAQVLRTHTSTVQARALASGKLPIKVASFGKVYRNETEDASHQAMFHQFDLIWVAEGLKLAHLTGLIESIVKGLFGRERKIRFVPKFYPYTEPSIGPQIDCSLCGGKGCPACGGAGWVTVGGAGMVHRNVLLEFNYDPEKVSGLAFGLGTARLASQFSGIPKLKMLYDSDLRILGRRTK
jgi:phenylalanyl-tRNA synthetase alpha chain